MLHRIFAYHLAALVLLTNIGIPVFTHVCHGQGKTWSSVLLPARSCCSKKKSDNEVKPCHADDRSCEKGMRPKPCCENHTSLLNTKSDFFNSHSTWVSKVKTSQQEFDAIFSISLIPDFSSPSLSSFSFQPHAPPVPLHGRSLLIFKQTLRC